MPISSDSLPFSTRSADGNRGPLFDNDSKFGARPVQCCRTFLRLVEICWLRGGFCGSFCGRLRANPINKYDAGSGIGWHWDKPLFLDIIAVSLLGSCMLRLCQKRVAERECKSRAIQARSAYLLRGEVRQV